MEYSTPNALVLYGYNRIHTSNLYSTVCFSTLRCFKLDTFVASFCLESRYITLYFLTDKSVCSGKNWIYNVHFNIRFTARKLYIEGFISYLNSGSKLRKVQTVMKPDMVFSRGVLFYAKLIYLKDYSIGMSV